FATATCLSDRYRINRPDAPETQELLKTFNYFPGGKGGPSPSYQSMNNVSPYQLVRCNVCPPGSNTGNCNQQGCGGGIIAEAIDFLVNHGGNSILGIED